MARSTPGVTRQRLVEEAVHLFSTRGYAATSVAEIQLACGLKAGSGALYKHFPSKRALLEEAVSQHLRLLARRYTDSIAELPEGPYDVLRLLGTVVWDVIDQDRDLIRIMLREFDGFPELFEQMWEGVLANLYRRCAEWIAAQQELGTVALPDPEATTDVLLSSLTYYPLLGVLIGHPPGNIDRERFFAAWLDHAARTLGLGERGGAGA